MSRNNDQNDQVAELGMPRIPLLSGAISQVRNWSREDWQTASAVGQCAVSAGHLALEVKRWCDQRAELRRQREIAEQETRAIEREAQNERVTKLLLTHQRKTMNSFRNKRYFEALGNLIVLIDTANSIQAAYVDRVTASPNEARLANAVSNDDIDVFRLCKVICHFKISLSREPETEDQLAALETEAALINNWGLSETLMMRALVALHRNDVQQARTLFQAAKERDTASPIGIIANAFDQLHDGEDGFLRAIACWRDIEVLDNGIEIHEQVVSMDAYKALVQRLVRDLSEKKLLSNIVEYANPERGIMIDTQNCVFLSDRINLMFARRSFYRMIEKIALLEAFIPIAEHHLDAAVICRYREQINQMSGQLMELEADPLYTAAVDRYFTSQEAHPVAMREFLDSISTLESDRARAHIAWFLGRNEVPLELIPARGRVFEGYNYWDLRLLMRLVLTSQLQFDMHRLEGFPVSARASELAISHNNDEHRANAVILMVDNALRVSGNSYMQQPRDLIRRGNLYAHLVQRINPQTTHINLFLALLDVNGKVMTNGKILHFTINQEEAQVSSGLSVREFGISGRMNERRCNLKNTHSVHLQELLTTLTESFQPLFVDQVIVVREIETTFVSRETDPARLSLIVLNDLLTGVGSIERTDEQYLDLALNSQQLTPEQTAAFRAAHQQRIFIQHRLQQTQVAIPLVMMPNETLRVRANDFFNPFFQGVQIEQGLYTETLSQAASTEIFTAPYMTFYRYLEIVHGAGLSTDQVMSCLWGHTTDGRFVIRGALKRYMFNQSLNELGWLLYAWELKRNIELAARDFVTQLPIDEFCMKWIKALFDASYSALDVESDFQRIYGELTGLVNADDDSNGDNVVDFDPEIAKKIIFIDLPEVNEQQTSTQGLSFITDFPANLLMDEINSLWAMLVVGTLNEFELLEGCNASRCYFVYANRTVMELLFEKEALTEEGGMAQTDLPMRVFLSLKSYAVSGQYDISKEDAADVIRQLQRNLGRYLTINLNHLKTCVIELESSRLIEYPMGLYALLFYLAQHANDLDLRTAALLPQRTMVQSYLMDGSPGFDFGRFIPEAPLTRMNTDSYYYQLWRFFSGFRYGEDLRSILAEKLMSIHPFEPLHNNQVISLLVDQDHGGEFIGKHQSVVLLAFYLFALKYGLDFLTILRVGRMSDGFEASERKLDQVLNKREHYSTVLHNLRIQPEFNESRNMYSLANTIRYCLTASHPEQDLGEVREACEQELRGVFGEPQANDAYIEVEEDAHLTPASYIRLMGLFKQQFYDPMVVDVFARNFIRS